MLTIGPFQSNNYLSIARGAIKRWPRLAGPVLVAVLISWSLWQAGAFWHVRAAAITGSEWLASFAAGVPPGKPSPDMSLKAAIAQDAWRTFVSGEHYFDLWTMKLELIGSGISFVLAAVLMVTRRRNVQIAIFICAATLLAYRNPLYLAFWSGVVLAWLRSIAAFNVPRMVAIPLLLIAIYLLGYVSNFGWYAWAPSGITAYLHTLASTLLIIAVTRCPPLRLKLDGTVGRILGRYSFPIYLAHLLAIFSVGTISFVLLYPLIGYVGAQFTSVVISLIGTAVLAHLLALFEGRWIAFVNWAADRILAAIGFRYSRPACREITDLPAQKLSPARPTEAAPR